MRTRPTNPNPRHAAVHTLYLAVTGGGKSQAVNANLREQLKANGQYRVVMWDQAGDYPGHHYETRQGFITALHSALKTGRGFRIAFAGTPTLKNWEWWCEMVWGILDGNRITYAIAEELSAVSPSAGKATDNAAIILNQGRKFGLRFHGVSQKPQEVAKTYFDQCPIKWIGQQKSRAMIRRSAEDMGTDEATIRNLKALEFLVDDGTATPPERTRIKPRTITGIHWHT